MDRRPGDATLAYMTSTAHLPPRSGRTDLQLHFVRGLLGCLSATALLGIGVVLTGSFHETGHRVLGSTLLAGLYCVLCLADMTVLGTRFGAVGAVGIATATVSLAVGLSLIWWTPDDFDGRLEYSLRGFVICAVIAFATAHAALLLRIDIPAQGAAAAVRTATLCTMSLVATLVAATMIAESVVEIDGYWRLLGVLAILDVLGTVSLPVLARFGLQNDARSAR